MLDQINFDRAHVDFSFDAHRDMVGVIGDPNGEGICVFEDPVYHQLWFDFDASDFTEVGFDHFFPLVGNGQAINLIVDVHIHWKLLSDGGGGVVEVSQVVNGRSDVLGVLWDGDFALFVSKLFIVVIVDSYILKVVGIFSHGFGISQGCLRLLVHPAFKFVSYFVSPIKTLEGFAFYAEGEGVFAIDDGTLGEDGHANDTRVYRAVVNSIFEDFSCLVGVVCHFST